MNLTLQKKQIDCQNKNASVEVQFPSFLDEKTENLQIRISIKIWLIDKLKIFWCYFINLKGFFDTWIVKTLMGLTSVKIDEQKLTGRDPWLEIYKSYKDRW